MIDYLQLMNASGMDFHSRQEEISLISRSLKGLAKELNIPIIALSQLSRDVTKREKDEDKRPQLSDLRESGAIEQDADIVTFIHRPEYYHIYQDANGRDLRGKAEIIVAKHRNGEVGDVRLTFRGEYARFENMESGYVPVPGEKQCRRAAKYPPPWTYPCPKEACPPCHGRPPRPLPPGTDLGAF